MLSVSDAELEAGAGVRGAPSRPAEAIADIAGSCDWQALQLLSSRLFPGSTLGRPTLRPLRSP